MARQKVRLLKPLNGAAIGAVAEYEARDAHRLIKLGAVEAVAVAAAAAPAKAAPRPKNKMERPPLNKRDASDEAPPVSGSEAPAEGAAKG